MNKVEHLGDKQHNYGEILFFALFIPWIACIILAETTLYGEFLCHLDTLWLLLMYFFPFGLVSIKLLLFDKMELAYKTLLLLVMCIFGFQFFNVVWNPDLYLTVLCIVAAYGIDFRKILRVYLIESVLLVCMYTTLAIVGVIPNIINHQHGMTRYAFGSIWCTDYSAKFFFMLLICLYLYSKKMRWFHWIGLVALSSVVFYFTFGKLDFICMMLALAVFFFHEQLQKQATSSKLKVFWQKLLERLAPLFTPIAAIIMTGLTLAYSPSISILQKLNDTLSGRLRLGHRAFSEIGMSLFGQDVTWIGMGNVSNDQVPEGYNFVDCSYLNILFTFGIFAALIAIGVFAYIAFHNRKDLHLVLVVAFISLNCIVAHHFAEMAYNPFWLVILAKKPEYSEGTPLTSILPKKKLSFSTSSEKGES